MSEAENQPNANQPNPPNVQGTGGNQAGVSDGSRRGRFVQFFTTIWANLGTIVATVVTGVLVLGFLYLMINAMRGAGGTDFISRLRDQEYARGLITFIISVSTIVLGFILVMFALFGSGTTEEERFRRGREVFTGLMGILGTIVGFYFGASEQAVRELQLAPIEFVDTGGGTQRVITYVSGGTPPYRYTVRFGDPGGPVIENKVSELGWIRENVPTGAVGRVTVEITDRANRQSTISRERETGPPGAPPR